MLHGADIYREVTPSSGSDRLDAQAKRQMSIRDARAAGSIPISHNIFNKKCPQQSSI